MTLSQAIDELKRRKVFRVAGAYVLAAVAMIAAASDVLPALRLPDWSVTLVAVLALAGLPVAVALAWAFDWSATGLTRETPAPSADASPRGIAVLPFANLSSDPENEYFADGITDDIIAQLSKIGGLRVISRTSVARYKGAAADAREISERLGVSSLLEGSVRREGRRVRVVVQLIDARRDEHLWANTYDRELADVFAIQSELALGVAESLRAHLTPSERERVSARPTADTTAYIAYLRGRAALNERTGDSIVVALRHFRAASEQDPAYAAPVAGMAEAHALLGMGFGSEPIASLRRAREAADRALALDPTLAEAHASLGWVLVHEWDWRAAEAALARAVELNPSYSQAHEWYGYLCAMTRRYEDALAAFQRAARLDPLSVVVQTELGWPYGYMGRWDEATAQFRRALELDATYAMAWFDLAWQPLAEGDPHRAIELLMRAQALDPDAPYIRAFLGRAYADAGEPEKAREIAAELTAAAARGTGLGVFAALVLEGLGRADEALDWIERAVRNREGGTVMLGIDRLLSFPPSFRRHPRFLKALEAMGLPPEGPLFPLSSESQPAQSPMP